MWNQSSKKVRLVSRIIQLISYRVTDVNPSHPRKMLVVFIWYAE